MKTFIRNSRNEQRGALSSRRDSKGECGHRRSRRAGGHRRRQPSRHLGAGARRAARHPGRAGAQWWDFAPGLTRSWSAGGLRGPVPRPLNWSAPVSSRWPGSQPPRLPPRWPRTRRSSSPARPDLATCPGAAASWPAPCRSSSRPASRSRGGGASTPARPRAVSPTCCCAPARRSVVAVDVGYGQLAWSLRTDARVTVLERANVRALTPGARWLRRRAWWWRTCRSSRSRLVLPALAACAEPDADFVLLVKPQFEVGKGGRAPGESSAEPALRG